MFLMQEQAFKTIHHNIYYSLKHCLNTLGHRTGKLLSVTSKEDTLFDPWLKD